MEKLTPDDVEDVLDTLDELRFWILEKSENWNAAQISMILVSEGARTCSICAPNREEMIRVINEGLSSENLKCIDLDE